MQKILMATALAVLTVAGCAQPSSSGADWQQAKSMAQAQAQLSAFTSARGPDGYLLHPRFQELRGTMAELMRQASADGVHLTLEEAYWMAAARHDQAAPAVATRGVERSWGTEYSVEELTLACQSLMADRNDVPWCVTAFVQAQSAEKVCAGSGLEPGTADFEHCRLDLLERYKAAAAP